MNEIPGLPINPHRHSNRQTLWQEFWTDFLEIFIGAGDPVGAFLSMLIAVAFIIKWGFFLIGKFVFKTNWKKPQPKRT